MVVTLAFSALFSEVTHERTAFPFTCTVHAPHCAMPQPNFVPVSFNSSRITQRSGVPSSEFAETDFPLSVNLTIEPPQALLAGPIFLLRHHQVRKAFRVGEQRFARTL